MAGFKVPDFKERAALAGAARQKALDQLRSKPAPDEAVVAEKLAARLAREAAAEERRLAKRAAEEEARAARREEAARLAALAVEAAAAAAAAAEKPVRTEAELKAARDARYAARKGRKG